MLCYYKNFSFNYFANAILHCHNISFLKTIKQQHLSFANKLNNYQNDYILALFKQKYNLINNNIQPQCFGVSKNFVLQKFYYSDLFYK